MSHHTSLATGTDPTFTARSRSTGEIVRRIAVYLRPYKGMAVANVGCAVLSLAFALASGIVGFAIALLTKPLARYTLTIPNDMAALRRNH